MIQIVSSKIIIILRLKRLADLVQLTIIEETDLLFTTFYKAFK